MYRLVTLRSFGGRGISRGTPRLLSTLTSMQQYTTLLFLSTLTFVHEGGIRYSLIAVRVNMQFVCTTSYNGVVADSSTYYAADGRVVVA